MPMSQFIGKNSTTDLVAALTFPLIRGSFQIISSRGDSDARWGRKNDTVFSNRYFSGGALGTNLAVNGQN